MEPLSFEWTQAREVKTGLKPPLTCGDLGTPDIDRISYYGAHHHLLVDPKRFGMGMLRYRQFSEFSPGGFFIPHLFALSVSDGTSVIEEADVTDYEWRPDYMQQKGKLGDQLQVVQRVGYTDAESIVMVLWVKCLADRPVTVNLSGEFSEHTELVATPLPSVGGLKFDVTAEVSNSIWGYPPSTLKRVFWLASDLKDATAEADGRKYSLSFKMKPGEFREIEIAFTSVEKT